MYDDDVLSLYDTLIDIGECDSFPDLVCEHEEMDAVPTHVDIFNLESELTTARSSTTRYWLAGTLSFPHRPGRLPSVRSRYCLTRSTWLRRRLRPTVRRWRTSLRTTVERCCGVVRYVRVIHYSRETSLPHHITRSVRYWIQRCTTWGMVKLQAIELGV